MASIGNSEGKFVIGMVNFKSKVFFEAQLRILFEFNPPERFHLLIVDNSLPSSEVDDLKRISEPYSGHANLEIIRNEASSERHHIGSYQHGQGLNVVLKRARIISEQDPGFRFLVVQDPDFFWMVPGYLDWLGKMFASGYRCIGAPYRGMDNRQYIRRSGTSGKSDFPAAYGCAYDLRCVDPNWDFTPDIEKTASEGKDVGWQMRNGFSECGYRYFSFHQNVRSQLRKEGRHSAHEFLCEYFLSLSDPKIVAFHLVGGTYVSGDLLADQITKYAPEEWVDSRLRFATLFYRTIKSGEPFVLKRRDAVFWAIYEWIIEKLNIRFVKSVAIQDLYEALMHASTAEERKAGINASCRILFSGTIEGLKRTRKKSDRFRKAARKWFQKIEKRVWRRFHRWKNKIVRLKGRFASRGGKGNDGPDS